MNLFAKKATSALAWVTLASAASAGMTLGVASPVHAIVPGLTVPAPFGGSWSNNPSSFGFFFDTTSSLEINALGLGFQNNWSAVTSNYDVTLWSFVNAGNNPADYTPIATTTFVGGQIYTLQQNYWWKGITPTLLPNTSNVVDPTGQKGYVITAIGDFSGGTTSLKFETGVPTISQFLDLSGNGFNVASSTNGFYPIPIAYDTSVGFNGYFNANLSIVPGPLPVLGVASAFGFSRRMRRRINAVKQS
jgi:hypothetical protein